MIKKAFIATIACLVINYQALDASLVLVLNDIKTSFGDVIVIDDMASGGVSSSGFWTSTVSDTNSEAGVVSFTGAIGNFTANITTGISKPKIGPNRIELTSVQVSGGGLDGGELRIILIDTDMSDNGYTFYSEITGTTTHYVDLIYSGVDTENGEHPASFQMVSTQMGLEDTFSYDASGPNMAAGNSGFSMAIAAAVRHSGEADVSSFNASFSQVPEPSTIMIWSTLGCMALVGVTRRRRM